MLATVHASRRSRRATAQSRLRLALSADSGITDIPYPRVVYVRLTLSFTSQSGALCGRLITGSRRSQRLDSRRRLHAFGVRIRTGDFEHWLGTKLGRERKERYSRT